MGEAHTQPDYPRGLTFEDVWAALMETRERQERDAREWREQQKETVRQIREQQKEAVRQIREQQKETERIFKETNRIFMETDRLIKEVGRKQEETDRFIKETDRQMKKTDRQLGKQLGELGNRFGEVIEYMVEPNLLAKFKELGLDFARIHHGTKIKDENDRTIAEADYSLENKDKVMIVEVKVKPSVEDIEDHITRIKEFRAAADLHGEKTIFLGAVAGIVIKDPVKSFALKNGFYIIRPSGKTFNITVPQGDYSPREW